MTLFRSLPRTLSPRIVNRRYIMSDIKYNTSIQFDLPDFDLKDKVVIVTGASG